MAFDDASPQYDDGQQQQQQQQAFTIPSASNLRLHINPDAIVTPDILTLYFGFGGNWNWQRNVVQAITQRVDNSRVLMDRNPTQEEIDAFVTHATRSLYEKRVGAPLGEAIAMARLYSQARGSPYFRGMMGMGSSADPAGKAGNGSGGGGGGAMPSPRQVLEGIITTSKTDPVGFRWGLGLVASRLFLWTLSGATLSGVFAVYNDAVGTFSDPRLADFVKQVKEQNPEELRKRKVDAASERYRYYQQMKQQPEGEQSQEQEQLSSEMIPDQPPQQQQQSATSGLAEGREYEKQDNGYASLYASSQREQREQRPVYDDSSRKSNQDTVSDFFDDASPTAPEYQGTSPTSTTTSQRGAWDRIRQQNLGSGRQQSYGQEYNNSSSNSSNYEQYNASYGGSSNGQNPDNERQRDREQARAEFERMLDSERNMSSDDPPSRSGSGKGWR